MNRKTIVTSFTLLSVSLMIILSISVEALDQTPESLTTISIPAASQLTASQPALDH